MELTKAMQAAMAIANRDGIVVAGAGSHAGHVERVSAKAIEALISRGILTRTHGSEGNTAGRLVKVSA